MGTAFVRPVNDDHSRVACAEVQDDETGATAPPLGGTAPARHPSGTSLARRAGERPLH